MFKFCLILLYCSGTIPTTQPAAVNPYYIGQFEQSNYQYEYPDTSNSENWYYPIQRVSDQLNPPITAGDQQMQSYNPPNNGGYQTSTDSYANIQQTTKKSVDDDDKKYKFYFPAVLLFFKAFYLYFLFLLARVTLFRNLGIIASGASTNWSAFADTRSLGSISWEFLEENINEALQTLGMADNWRTNESPLRQSTGTHE